MKARLQYAAAAVGPWSEVGVVRTARKEYRVRPLTDDNRLGVPHVVGYNVTVDTRHVTLEGSFLSQASWHFRLYFPAEDLEIRLGQRAYFSDYNPQLPRNTITLKRVRLDFSVGRTEYSKYTVPAAESGIVYETAIVAN